MSDDIVHRAEVVLPEREQSQRAEPVKVVRVTEVDFAWHEPSRCFMPVFGSTHGDPVILEHLRGKQRRTGRVIEANYREVPIEREALPRPAVAALPKPKRPSARYGR